jgi:2-polyprenyl-3-methyl-5-hydroxy-6-metoxy-1,4-benzoquinol methylase
MHTAATPHSTYALGHSEHELKRLGQQGRAFEPFTRQLFGQAEIATGMRILDVGCGAGDVSFLAAEFVGPTGEVVGVDHATAAVEWAKVHAKEREIRNVTFLEGDPAIMAFDEPFDVVVGRLVLMYYPDPIAAVQKLVQHVRPGGLIVFQEFDMDYAGSFPPALTFNRVVSWIKRTLVATGARIQLGLELFPIFVAAGLPEPSLRMDAVIGGGSEFPCEILVALMQSLLPVMEKLGVATAKEVELSTLVERMRNEVIARRGIVLSPALIGAWSRKSS